MKRVSIIGHIDHNRTSLTAAITRVLMETPIERQGKHYAHHGDIDGVTGQPLKRKPHRRKVRP